MRERRGSAGARAGRGRRRAGNVRRRRRWLWPVLALGVLALAAAVGGLVAWERMEPETRALWEDRLAGGIHTVRETSGVPEDVRRLLDGWLDRLPTHVGPLVEPGWQGPRQGAWFGGAPVATDGRDLQRLVNRGYEVGWDPVTRSPAWAAYRVFRVTGGAPPRPDGFRVDPRVPGCPAPAIYRNSGYDRGHLAPSYAVGRGFGDEAQRETFWMTNIVPQLPEFNRGPWRRLEGRLADRLAIVLEELWVTVGPLYEGVHWRHTLGDGIPIPDGFYCIVLDERKDGRVRALALRLPARMDRAEDWDGWLTTVEGIEAEAALDFFPGLAPEAQRALESVRPTRFW